MMKRNLTEDNLNRLALSIMERHGCDYDEACEILSSYKLKIVCGDIIKDSLSHQAALITAINCGKRSFLGGVYVELDTNIASVLPGRSKSLVEIVLDEGATLSDGSGISFTLYLGVKAPDSNGLEIKCNSWQGGYVPVNDNISLVDDYHLPIGGVAAGALSVAAAFLKTSGIDVSVCDQAQGISLWRPDIDWSSSEATGPHIDVLPSKYWILGLGHLGQAYLWNIALLPFSIPAEVTFLLQDYDKVTEANWSAGLLCTKENAGQYKTRMSAEWLEDKGFNALISERKFDKNTHREDGEPYLALCGFDKESPRTLLENAGFDLVVEAGIGGSLSTFDDVAVHVFPNPERPASKIWKADRPEVAEYHKTALDKFSELDMAGCGIISQTLASKAISTSFVGALTGALVVSEILRATCGGKKYQKVSFQIRNLKDKSAILHSDDTYSTELVKNGFTPSIKVSSTEVV